MLRLELEKYRFTNAVESIVEVEKTQEKHFRFYWVKNKRNILSHRTHLTLFPCCYIQTDFSQRFQPIFSWEKSHTYSPAKVHAHGWFFVCGNDTKLALRLLPYTFLINEIAVYIAFQERVAAVKGLPSGEVNRAVGRFQSANFRSKHPDLISSTTAVQWVSEDSFSSANLLEAPWVYRLCSCFNWQLTIVFDHIENKFLCLTIYFSWFVGHFTKSSVSSLNSSLTILFPCFFGLSCCVLLFDRTMC